jgi:SAM-dependent methyltransferase
MGTRGLSIAAISLSAFLLFSIELLAGRLVLPVFGGTPGVWATTLSFFTAVLFLGYVYAHLVATRLSPRTGGWLHLGVALLALATLAVAPAHVATLRHPGMAEPLNVLLAQALLVGGPAFLLASTTPLLSAWYARRGGDAWWFYAASNAASLAGLLAYPLVIEPRLGLGAQRLAVAIGVAVFVVLIGAVVLRASRTAEPVPPDDRAPAPAPLTMRRQVTWLIAAFVPAGLLAATTNFITTDLVSAPLLWVGPLGIYLASFIVAFSARGRRILPAINLLFPLAAMLLFFPFVVDTSGAQPWLLLASELGAFWVVATGIHGRLALHRPEESHLTRFYLVISAGGMLATAFVALLAPLIFRTIYEYPILILTGLAVPILLPRARRPRLLELVGISIIASLLVAWVATADNPYLQQRSFFGVIRLDTDGVITLEFSGSTLHGIQFLDARRSEPTTYYVREGPLGDAFADLRARLPRADIGVVGLGVGTAAAYAQPGDTLTFFEINPTVVQIAEDPGYLTYLSDAAVTPRIVVGDARLSLADEPAGSFDLLILDAFSSDAVPAHLLTREAMDVYRRVMRPGGLIVFHLSNRFYDLAPPVAATAASRGLDAAVRVYFPPSSEIARIEARVTIWEAVGAAADVQRLRALGTWRDAAAGPLLTDDYADLLRVLRLGGL